MRLIPIVLLMLFALPAAAQQPASMAPLAVSKAWNTQAGLKQTLMVPVPNTATGEPEDNYYLVSEEALLKLDAAFRDQKAEIARLRALIEKAGCR